jgi:hypothetical protein
VRLPRASVTVGVDNLKGIVKDLLDRMKQSFETSCDSKHSA